MQALEKNIADVRGPRKLILTISEYLIFFVLAAIAWGIIDQTRILIYALFSGVAGIAPYAKKIYGHSSPSFMEFDLISQFLSGFILFGITVAFIYEKWWRWHKDFIRRVVLSVFLISFYLFALRFVNQAFILSYHLLTKTENEARVYATILQKNDLSQFVFEERKRIE
jgi:hypothetical protein